MTDQLLLAEDRLLQGLAAEARGPKRNGLFALWLFVRQCDGRLPPGELSEPADRARLERFEKRLSSLSLPAPLRRALPGSVRGLREGGTNGIAVALHQLIAPAREALGRGAAEALALAARSARDVERTRQVTG